ncbi:MAG: hypothetical protein A4E42_00925 [Methanoregulaceae archaeon PtaU1.Bin222]|nr:MAG: hypothetical protein A4E42_00925 [Methanoregulaceae archaeon PtaU1.Bin222]
MIFDIKSRDRDHFRSLCPQADFVRSRSAYDSPVHKDRFTGNASADGPQSILEILGIDPSLREAVSCLLGYFDGDIIHAPVPAYDLAARTFHVDETTITKPRCDNLPEYPPRFGSLSLVGQVAGHSKCPDQDARGDAGILAGKRGFLCRSPSHDPRNEYSRR